MPIAQPSSIPSFLYGTAWKEDRTAALTELALRSGFRAIDTANQRKHYFEAAVGQGLAAAYAAGIVTRATQIRGENKRARHIPLGGKRVRTADSRGINRSRVRSIGSQY